MYTQLVVPERASDFENFAFFLLHDVVDLLYVLIGQFLDLGFRLAQFVFGQLGVFLKFLELFIPIPAEPADLQLSLLRRVSCTLLMSSFRRSSVRGGRGMRMSFPSLDGVSPRSEI